MKTDKILQEDYIDGGYKIYCTVIWDESYKTELLPRFRAKCGCCENTYAIPSTYSHIKKYGYCDWCLRYKEGTVRYVQKRRDATVDEIIKNEYNKSGAMCVLLNEIKRLQKHNKE